MPAAGARVGRAALERSDGDDGSAVVEFVLVSVLLLALFLAVLDLGLTIFVRNTLVATAAEGARYGANADRTPDDALGRTRDVLRSSLSGRWVDDVTAGYADVDGVRTVAVRIEGDVPALGFIPFAPHLSVTGHAFAEAP